MGFRTKTVVSKVLTIVWEWRVWAPLTTAGAESPTISVRSFTGTQTELIRHLRREIRQAANEDDLPTLMSLAWTLLDEFEKRGDT